MNLNTVEFLLQEAWTSIRRNGIISAAAVTNITVVLVVGGLFILLVANVGHFLSHQAGKAVLTVDLAADAKPAEIEAALRADVRVKRTLFLSKDRNLQQLARLQGWDPESLRYLKNPLPDCIKVEPQRPEDLPALAAMAQRLPGVAEVRYGQELTERLLALVRAAKMGGLSLIIFMALASLLIIATTIRLTIYARRREIRIMQLVGATHWFIRLPFLLEGLLYGLAGGILAAVVLLVGYSYLDQQVTRALAFLPLLFSPRLLALLAGLMVSLGVVFGLAGSLLATREYLREV
jgi:cell division transport system permease protein